MILLLYTAASATIGRLVVRKLNEKMRAEQAVRDVPVVATTQSTRVVDNGTEVHVG